MKTQQVTQWLAATVLWALSAVALAAATPTPAATPDGYWAAKDDSTGKVLSVIQVWKAADGSYDGRIYKIMDVTVDGKRQDPSDKCTTCSGVLANKPFLCMQVVYNMQASTDTANTWDSGQAYDPKTDNTYKAKMWLDDSGNVLNVRGYIMMPLLGRTQVWTRVDKPANSSWVCSRSIADSYSLPQQQ
ncbi:MAG: DUF2147 domain-containing protein [Gammaproteobacteria bacterium]|nr:DUF2147 domain-containing protein [Gammaproteobacteria bacterium]